MPSSAKLGEVIDSIPGLYDTCVLNLDFSGLYPSIIMAYNICFSTQVSNYVIEKMKLVEGVHYVRTFDTKFDEKTNTITYIYDDKFPAFLLPGIKEGTIFPIHMLFILTRFSNVRSIAKIGSCIENTS